ncbi:hypothetical protein [Kitasatospora purpeofusca]|uniref:hypothetical protein n=1 Tax=Kitasatospora purpeofusca TaxID=67352 RepID=UPI0038106AA2
MYDRYPGEDATASEIADTLTNLRRTTPATTIQLTNLVEATVHWTLRHPQLAEAHHAFAVARAAYWPYSHTDQGWSAVHTAAQTLGAQLRQFGDEQMVHCDGISTGGLTCPGILDAAGACCYAEHHDRSYYDDEGEDV